MSKTTITAPENLPIVQITREFDAPRDLVFRAHTEPELLKQWLGPRKYEMEIERLEVRDGGRWRYFHRGEEGTFAFRGVFHGDPSPDRTVQTFEFEGYPGHVQLETLTLEERGGKTFLRVNSVFESVEDRDGMVASGMETGVVEGYERLDELFARMAAPVN